MDYRKLGRTNLEVSALALGCSGYWGLPQFPEPRARAVVERALDAGINFFDTGHNYSRFNAEPRLGRILHDLVGRDGRARIIISSKAGTTMPSAPVFRHPERTRQDFSPTAIEAACRRSIANLRCDYLDIFQLHGIGWHQLNDALLTRLADMQREGLFRHLGINSHSGADLAQVARHPELFDVALLDYNVLQQDREAVIRDLQRAGVGVIAGTVLAQGHLLNGKFGVPRSAADIWYLARALLKPASRRLATGARRTGMPQLLESFPGLSPAQAAFAFVRANPAITSCAFGTTRPDHLDEILAVLDKHLADEDLAAIRQAVARHAPDVSR